MNTQENNAVYTLSQIDKLNLIDQNMLTDMEFFNMSFSKDCENEYIDWDRIDHDSLPEHLKYLSDMFEVHNRR